VKDIILSSGTVLQFAAADEKKPGQRPFKQMAYSGDEMYVGGVGRCMVELSGIKVKSQRMPTLREHDPAQIVGYSESINVTKAGVEVAGRTVRSFAAKEVTDLADDGFPWQASIRCMPQQVQRVEAGATVKCNGRDVRGPIAIVKQSLLQESSFVPLGADGNTSSEVLAATLKGDANMAGTEETAAPAGNVIKLSDALTVGEVKAHAPKVYDQIKAEALREHRERMDTIATEIKASGLSAGVQAVLASSCANMSIGEARSEIARVGTIEAALAGCRNAKMPDELIASLRSDVGALTASAARSIIEAAANSFAKVSERLAVAPDPALTGADKPASTANAKLAEMVKEARTQFKASGMTGHEAEYIRNYLACSVDSRKENAPALNDAQLKELCPDLVK
jgi:uncharacterized protein with GYD domain